MVLIGVAILAAPETGGVSLTVPFGKKIADLLPYFSKTGLGKSVLSKGSEFIKKITAQITQQNKLFPIKPQNNSVIVTKFTNRSKLTGPGAPSNVNAQDALKEKFKDLQIAQSRAVKIKKLPDGRMRYYHKEIPASKFGKTRGASYVTEYNPKTGSVKSWYENFGHDSKTIRVHVKKIDGKEVMGPHYPKTGKEIIGETLYKNYNELKLEELINTIKKK